RVTQSVENPASLESLGKTRGRLLVVIEPVEQVGANFHTIYGRPFKKFRSVKPVLPGDVTRRQTALPNPTNHGSLRDVQRLAHASRTELHRLLSRKLVGRPCSNAGCSPHLSRAIERASQRTVKKLAKIDSGRSGARAEVGSSAMASPSSRQRVV